MRVAIQSIIQTYLRLGKVSDTARELGISRPAVYRWLKRGRKRYRHGYMWRGIRRRSTRPKHIKRGITPSQELLILQTQDKYHWGAKKLKPNLKLFVSSRTVHRLLKYKGKTRQQSHYRRPLFQNGACMRPANTTELGYLQMDTKHVTPELSGLAFTVL